MREREYAKTGTLPLAYLLEVLRDENEERSVRIDAAKAAAPYVHPRLNAVQHSGNLQLDVHAWLTGAAEAVAALPDLTEDEDGE